MSKSWDADERFEATYPELHKLLIRLAAYADSHGDDRVERTIADYAKVRDENSVRETIRELEAALKVRPVDYDTLSEIGNYTLDSEAEAEAFLLNLLDGLKAALAVRIQKER